MLARFGIIGVGTMGGNLARNFAQHAISTVVYDRSYEKTEQFITAFGSELLTGQKSLADFVASLEQPRKILLMVTAGDPVDAVIAELTPLLVAGDSIIDGGNSLFSDTLRRTELLARQEIVFMGMGISGGEEGALHGPSMMMGGITDDKLSITNKGSVGELRSMLEKIAARDFEGKACLGWFGGAGSGHYVKMIHNGIEYAIMQLIAETYQFLRKVHQLPADQIGAVFAEWHKGKLNSYLIDITAKVLQKHDDADAGFLIDKIKDQAGQKGTGQWTVQDAFGRGIPVPSIVTAVEARQISSFRSIRQQLSQTYKVASMSADSTFTYSQLEEVLYSGIVLCYIQGLTLIATTAKEEGWNIDLSEVIRIWQGGCIIRATLLTDISAWLKNTNAVSHLLAVPAVQQVLSTLMPQWKQFLTIAIHANLPLVGYQGTYQYFLAMTEANCSANLIQGLRDFFGAHTYERLDREGIFHTQW